MENAKNPGDTEDDLQESKSTQSKEEPKTMPNLMVRIPAEFLSERQKRLLSQKPKSKDEPSTSSEKKEDIFKVPQVPPLRKKKTSPSKASSNTVPAPLLTKVNEGAERQDRKSTQSKEPKTMPNLKVKIPVEVLSERQKRLLCQKRKSKDEPSTSSEKKEDIFKVPEVPPLREKETSPSKASSNAAPAPLSTTVNQTVQDAVLKESTDTSETVGNEPVDKEDQNET